MKTSPWKIGAAVSLAIGALLLIVGFTLGISSITRDGVTCGSMFSPQTQPGITASYEANPGATPDCESARSDRQAITLSLLIPGGVLVVGSLFLFLAGVDTVRPAAAASEPPSAPSGARTRRSSPKLRGRA